MGRQTGRPALRRPPTVALVLLTLGVTAGCAARSAPVLIAQSALGTAQTVGQLQVAAEQLHRTGALSTAQALTVQQRLLRVNTRLGEVVPVLKAIDRLQQAGAPVTLAEVDAVLAAVIAISEDLSLVVAGVPVADSTRALLDLVQASQQAVATTLVEIARLRAALAPR